MFQKNKNLATFSLPVTINDLPPTLLYSLQFLFQTSSQQMCQSKDTSSTAFTQHRQDGTSEDDDFYPCPSPKVVEYINNINYTTKKIHKEWVDNEVLKAKIRAVERKRNVRSVCLQN